MSNDARVRIFDWYASASVRGGVLVCFGAGLGLSPLTAFADAGLPPPAVHQQTDNGFPSSQALKNQGYDPQSGKITVNKTGSPKVSSSGGKITGTQNVRIDTVDRYGNRGTINSSVSQTVSKVSAAALASNVVFNAISNNLERANSASDNFSRGNYADGLRDTAIAIGGAIDGVFTGNFLGDFAATFGKEKADDFAAAAQNAYNNAINGGSSKSESLNKAAAAAKSAQSKAMNDGNAAGAITAAAAAKAASAAANAAAQSNQAKQEIRDKLERKEVVYVGYLEFAKGSQKSGYYVPYYTNNPNYIQSMGIYPNGKLRVVHGKDGPLVSYFPQSGDWGHVLGYLRQVSEKNIDDINPSAINPSDMALTADEVKKILEQMLNNQQTNHKELMNQLSKINAGTTTINNTENNTTINNGGNRPKGNSVVDKATENVTNNGGSTRSAPYTPAGSSQAQQTEWTLNPDGSVTTNIIPRPDLKPNSSQAPTRSEVYGNNQSQNSNQAGQNQQGNQPSQNQQQQQQNFCKENPNSAACAELGDASYEDLLIPENPVDLELKPLNIFSTDGVCPANPTFTFGALGTLEIDYQYFCSIARLLRPILILGTMIMCGFVAYNAVKEL